MTENSMATAMDVLDVLKEETFSQKFHPEDASLLNDLIHLSQRPQNVHELVKRIDKSSRNMSVSKQEIDVLQCDIEKYISCLVHCYFHTADTIRISRAVEKLWKPYEAVYKDWIKKCLESHVTEVLQSAHPQQDVVCRLSVLLERNACIQEVVKNKLTAVCWWVNGQMSSLLQLQPQKLSLNQSQFLYAVVKICLQLFQVCPKELGARIWSHDVIDDKHGGEGDTSSMVHSIVKKLVHVLSTEGYGADCVLLSGTATALLLKSAPSPQASVQAFYNLLLYICSQDADFNVDQLQKTVQPSEIVKLQSTLSSSPNINGFSLIRGVMACWNMELLFYEVEDAAFMFNLFSFIETFCQSAITLHYHAFQALLLWYSRMTKANSRLKSYENHMTSVYGKTVQLVLLNWDSPVEDVPEAVVEVFSAMMNIWMQYPASQVDLPQQILDRLLQTYWYIKGKYRILSALIKYVDAQKILEDFPLMKDHLLRCLKTNHLTSSATNVYRAFLQQIQQHASDAVEVWRCSWLSTVHCGLISTDSLLRYNVSLHWIPATFQILPQTAASLQRHLADLLHTSNHGSCHVRLLHAWIVVTRTIRTMMGTADLTADMVREALYCADEDVRSEALALICSTLRKAEVQSEVEVTLLKESLPYNIKIDSAPFRQHLGSNIRKLLVRIRDSCITMLKSPETHVQDLGRGLAFVDWLHSVCMECLYPGACYQRRKGSLDLLHVVYETLIYSQDSRHRKGFTPKTSQDLVAFAQTRGQWNFFCTENCTSLLLCVLDGADEIQTSAGQLLTRYYALPLDLSCVSEGTNLPCHLMSQSLRLCNSPKGHESQSGAVLCRLIFYKYIVCLKYQLDFSCTGTGEYYVSMETNQQASSPVGYLWKLLSEVKRCLSEAEHNLVDASKNCPIHGLITALTKCLTETEELWDSSSSELFLLLEDSVEMCATIIEKMLGIMSRVAGQEACPSFAEIGMALETLLQESHGDYTDSTSQTPEYQYMLSWCWNNIKESCVFLGEVTWSAVTTSSHHDLKITTVQRISDTFLTVLTKCRHKGVIEGCRTAFIRFCSALFQGGGDTLQELPNTILTQIMSSLKNNSMRSSVTRRSAGLPIILLSILVSEKQLKKNLLLMKSVKDLFETSSLPLPEDLDELHDLPQVHSLNILNALFSDAKLASSLMGYISHTVILVIQKFGSASWAIRNAATRLFSTLVTRLFGQKKGGEDITRNAVTFLEFQSHYPELPPFLLEVLREASVLDVKAIDQLHPSLFPALTVLAGLNPVESHDEQIVSLLKEFEETILNFLASPVYQLRHLSASAMVAMTTIPSMIDRLIWLMETRFSDHSCSDSNQCHGHLLLVHRLLGHIHKKVDIVRILDSLLDRQSIIQSEMPCLVKAEYLKILSVILNKYPDLSLTDSVTEALTHIVCGQKRVNSQLDIGDCLLSTEAVNLLLTRYKDQSDCSKQLPLVSGILTSHDLEARHSGLCYMKNNISVSELPSSMLKHVQTQLVACLQTEKHIPNIAILLDLVLELHFKQGTNQTDINHISDWLSANQSTVEKYTSLSSASLPVAGMCIEASIKEHDRSVNVAAVKSWCERVCCHSDISQNETLRMSSARAVLVAGDAVLHLIATNKRVELETCAVRLISTCLTLIQDEDTEIRGLAAQFISILHWQSKTVQYSSIQSNVCYELMLDFVASEFWWSNECVLFLWDQLYKPQALSDVVTERKQTRYLQLFDQEDNSFFGERIDNGVFVFRTLEKILTSRPDYPSTLVRDTAAVVEQDITGLNNMLAEIKQGSVIHPLIDSTVLATVCGLLQQAVLVLIFTDRKSSKFIPLLDAVQKAFKNDRLPRNLMRMLAKYTDVIKVV